MKERWYRLLTWLPARYQTLSPQEALRGQLALGAARAGPAPAQDPRAQAWALSPAPRPSPAAPAATFAVAVQWGAAQRVVLGQGAPATPEPSPEPWVNHDESAVPSDWTPPDAGPHWFGEPPEAPPVLLAAPSDPAHWEPYETLDDAALAAYERSAESQPDAFAAPEALPMPDAEPGQPSMGALRDRGHQAISRGVQQARSSMLN